MHYSRVSIPPSQSYSAPTAVLFNELLKGSISLVIAFTQIDRSTSYTSDTLQLSLITGRFWNPAKVLLRVRRLGREVFSPDCWKLSIPAILYGV
jgi:UDP-sugar transporter A1/2/3